MGYQRPGPHPQHPKMLKYLLFFPFLLRPEGPQTGFEASKTLWGCVLLGDELQKDEPFAPWPVAEPLWDEAAQLPAAVM